MGGGQAERRLRKQMRHDQSGFTLIELLVTMLIGVIALSGGTLVLARAFSSSTQASARTNSTGQAAVGFERLLLDLRYASPCPTYNATNTLGTGGQSVSGLLVSGGPVLQICDPVAGAHASYPAALALVTWTCDTTPAVQSCRRTAQAVLCGVSPATGNCPSSAPTLGGSAAASSVVNGVGAITVSGIVSGTNQPSLLSGACVSGGVGAYFLNGSTCPISWVGIQAQVNPLIDPAAPSDASNAYLSGKVSSVQVQTGTALENFGP